jgi:tRNA(adenine34) deaminase
MNGRIIAETYCSDKRERMLAHAELLALIKADKKQPTRQQRREMTLYTNLEPCVMCLGAAMAFCLGTIVYGINAPADGAATRLSGMSFGNATYSDYQMPIIVSGVLKEESRLLFHEFIENSTETALVNFSLSIVVADSNQRVAVPSSFSGLCDGH